MFLARHLFPVTFRLQTAMSTAPMSPSQRMLTAAYCVRSPTNSSLAQREAIPCGDIRGRRSTQPAASQDYKGPSVLRKTPCTGVPTCETKPNWENRTNCPLTRWSRGPFECEEEAEGDEPDHIEKSNGRPDQKISKICSNPLRKLVTTVNIP